MFAQPGKILLFVLLFLSFQLRAQYGFEWISSSQPYYKFPVARTGVHRIGFNALVNAGIPATVKPGKIQLFRNGAEVPVYIAGEQDGVFDPSDYIEFYAEKNDGKLDSLIYQTPANQPHQYNSLFSDTAYYFLTILPDASVITPARFTLNTNTNYTGLTPEDYFVSEEVVAPMDEYLDGPDMVNSTEKYVSSEYQDGEGWSGRRFGIGDPALIQTVSTPFAYTLGPLPTLSVKVIGASNARTAGMNHHVTMEISPDNSNFTLKADQKFSAYASVVFNPHIAHEHIGANTYLRFSVVNDLGAPSDYNCVSYILLQYARTFDCSLSSQKLMSVVNTKGGANTYVSITNYQKTAPFVFDLTNRTRYELQASGGAYRFMTANDGRPHKVYLYDNADVINIASLKPVTFDFTRFNPSQQYEYVLVSNPVLEPAAGNYASYRSQKYHVLKVYSEELYDYYFYGNPHPLAVRRMIAHMATVKLPSFLTLAGRGYQNDKIRTPSVTNPDAVRNYNGNLVPVIGMPGADALFSNGITGAGHFADVMTGRVPAATSAELQGYLDKLIYYETTFDSLPSWRKNVLHISGGKEETEQTRFRNQLNNVNKPMIEGKSFGARVFVFSKSNTDPQQVTLREQLVKIQNDGITMLSFLGHASLTILDVDIGNIQNMQNQGRYPFYYFSGCNVGNASEVDPPKDNRNIYAKDYICTPNAGAIGWLAHSNFTFDGNLYTMMNGFYSRFSGGEYGRPIGKIIYETTKALSGSAIVKSHNIQWMLQGDPAVVISSPQLPDYALKSSSLFMFPSSVSAQSDSLAIGVIVDNYGRATDDTITLSLRRTMPNGNQLTYPAKKYRRVYLTDTFYYWIPNTEQSVGRNEFVAMVDALSAVTEGNENNNTASFSYFIPGQGLQLIYPKPYAVVNKDTVEFVIQTNDLFAQNNEYILELDTTVAFNSGFAYSTGIVASGSYFSKRVPLLSADSVVYYWRARLNLPVEQGGAWNKGSFTRINSVSDGWMQSRFEQYTNHSSTNRLVLNDTTHQLEFDDNGAILKAKIARWWHGGLGILNPSPMNPSVGSCISNGVVCVLFDKRTLLPFENPRFPFNCTFVIDYNQTHNEKIYYYPFQTNTPAGQDEFRRFIDSVGEDTYVALYSYYDAGIPGWQQATRDAFTNIGSVKVAAAQSFYTGFVLIGQKGGLPGTANEDTVFNDTDHTQNVNDTAYAEVTSTLLGKWFTGSMQSLPVGPANIWGQLHYTFNSQENGADDRVTVSVIGVKSNNEDSVIIQNAANPATLSMIDASNFRYLKLGVTFLDSVNRTPDQFGHWMITYTGVPEGSVFPDTGFVFYKESIQQGDSISFSVPFKNISEYAFDSIPVKISITDENRVEKYASSFKTQPLSPGERIVLKDKINSNNLQGLNKFSITFNPSNDPAELTLFNNFMGRDVNVIADQTNPVMDVTFDGYRIMNGDYVSPTPNIVITTKDDNKYKLLEDTSLYTLMLKRPDDQDYNRVELGTSEISFTPGTSENNKAMIQYRPAFSEDGEYSLKVLTKDASGNLSGNDFYEIAFKVEKASTITNFFPYPNPCTTNMKFVFTLTGSKVPDDLLVRIMTVTGKIVREVTKDEFGNMKIGNNVSEWSWDGTDTYGDRLANGVYLYQVLTRIDGKALEHKTTKADQFFIQDTGKIYLMK